MKKERAIIYVKSAPEASEVVYSGIEFAEFIEHLPEPVENLMIITGGCSVIAIDSRFERRLELFDGVEAVKKLAKENIYDLGDFCFVDYATGSSMCDLSDGQIAELLYLGHMFKPLNSPFFGPLQNRFAYLSHDDGYYCKLYCRDPDEFMPVLIGKIAASIKVPAPDDLDIVTEKLALLCRAGILIDFGEAYRVKRNVDVKIHVIGEQTSIDGIMNNLRKSKNAAMQIHHLHCSKQEWTLY